MACGDYEPGGLSDMFTLNSRYNCVEIEPERLAYRSSCESHCIGARRVPIHTGTSCSFCNECAFKGGFFLSRVDCKVSNLK